MYIIPTSHHILFILSCLSSGDSGSPAHSSSGQRRLPNVGEAKGAILSEAVKTRAPSRALELGTHLGYGEQREKQIVSFDNQHEDSSYEALLAVVRSFIMLSEYTLVVDVRCVKN